MRKFWLILLFFAILTTVWWWPLPRHLLTGQLDKSLIDPLYNQWIIAWGAHALTHYPWHFFDANMFYPFHQTLAWGDNLFSLTIFALPLLPIFGLLGTYNILLLGSTIFSAFTIYLLVRHLTKHRPSAVVAGLIWGFSHYRWSECGHIQILWTIWLPLIFLYAEKIREKFSRRDFLLLIAAVFLMLTANVYLAIFVVISFAVYFIGLLICRLINWRSVGQIILGWLAAGLLALPLYWPSFVLQQQAPVIRDIERQEYLHLHNLLPWPWPGKLIQNLLDFFGRPVEAIPTQPLSLLIFILLLAGLIRLVAERREWRKNLLYVIFLLTSVVGFIAAAGPRIYWREKILVNHNWLFYWFYDHFPGYSVMRVPLRWYIVILVGLTVFGSWGLAKWLRILRPRWQYLFVLLCATWLFIEQAPTPTEVYSNYRWQDYPVYQWLKNQPGEFPILELPAYAGNGYHPNDVIEARRMYLSTFHWKKRVTGTISPGIIKPYLNNIRIINTIGQDSAALELLKKWQVKYIVYLPADFIDLGLPPDEQERVKRQLDSMPELKKEVEYDNGTIYKIIY
ncbi:MAG: hypothetical protein CEN88_135 [Candidatus Berkelbacteria bacterium Licking1014_2]|uniref:Glycosyltransferase RgtA/B/C/D-like domain-containing protein n=1 Tax=Candidatus Berkelbacteria bacterium Licking1014_2 TaxID=2017146 RepID=A0A554LWD3_9BACT|nr:MAG: hypothetical protein CEN88_135 [Candidatus Berkelbacteria bacterium Licking1014_2]